jgi:hypothetical protein
MLVAAGLKDVTPLGMEGIPKDERPSDYIWQTGHLIGGIRERLAPKDKSLADLAGLHIQGLKNKCSGAFKAEVGREEDMPRLKLRTAEAECAMKGPEGGKDGKEKDIAVAILFYLTEAGRFTVFTHEGLAANKAEAIAARNAIKREIIDLTNGWEENR